MNTNFSPANDANRREKILPPILVLLFAFIRMIREQIFSSFVFIRVYWWFNLP